MLTCRKNTLLVPLNSLKISTDVNHLLEDSIKNIKSATDALKNIMCRFPNARIHIVKLANVYSIQIIQTKVALIKYSLKDKQTFKAVECCSSLVPTSNEEKIHLMSVYDMLVSFTFVV